MSTKLNVLTVVLEQEMAEEAIETLAGAIRQMRNVLTVTATTPTNHETFVAEERARTRLVKELLTMLYPNLRK